MSKPVKDMLVRDYRERLGDIEDVTLISLRGVKANDNNTIRRTLGKKDIKVTIIRNRLFSKAYADSGLAAITPMLSGPTALAYGAESVVEVAREIVGLFETFPDMALKGAVLDGELFEGEEGVKRLSKFPTRDEAISEAVAMVFGPGKKLVAAVKGPGSNLGGIVKAIEEKLEKGETIAKV